MKRYILILMLLGPVVSKAQQEGEFKLRMYLGYGNGESGGIVLGMEPKYHVAPKTAVGLRLGTTLIFGRNATFDNPQNYDEDSYITSVAVSSLTATFDRYFHQEGENIAAFVGGGVGYYKSTDIDVLENNSSTLLRSEDVNIRGQIGLMVRTGFEFGKFRMDGEYNLLPSADIDFLNEGTIGTLNDSYFAISFAFTIDGGKWSDN